VGTLSADKRKLLRGNPTDAQGMLQTKCDPFRILPPHTAQELAVLRASIEAEGLHDPIILDTLGNIIDGHARRDICIDPGRPSSPTTPSTEANPVEPVEDVESLARKPDLEWPMEAGLDRNFNAVGKVLVSLGLPLFRHSEGGLLLVEGDKPIRITSAKELAPFLIDTIRISVTKKSKYHGEKPSDSILNNMLRSRSFLDHFATVEELVKTPIVLPDFVPSQPGFNDGGILHLGPAVAASKGISTINTFLDVMEWQGNADRTNAVAALLTVPFRRHFTGGKPLVLVTASQSHAGKGTLIDFIRGRTAKADILYENIDWPMQRQLHEQLHECPEVGVISFDNVRIDSSGRARIIRSGFLESFITNSEIVMSSTARRPIRMANRFLVLLNTNEGSLSIDLLNRSLPIRLAPSGDVTDRIAKAKSVLGGDVKHEWLPAHRDQIEAELWGMIDHWIQEGKPLDQKVKHPMGPWAKTIGGILMVNSFTDFLDNYSATRAAADPIREAISILAFHAGHQWERARVMAMVAGKQGLAKVLLPGADPNNDPACERAMGVTLSAFVGQTFSATTATELVTYRLEKKQGRFEKEKYPHFRYRFEEIKREQVSEQDVSGIVLDANATNHPTAMNPSDLNHYVPEVI
jgi:hypothetical protein